MKLIQTLLGAIVLLTAGALSATGQQPARTPARPRTQPKTQRPVKNPPQFPHIIEKETAEEKPAPAEAPPEPAAPPLSEELVRAVQSVATEVRTLVFEMRAFNVRQQALIDTVRLARGDQRIESSERELQTIVDRLTQLETEERNLVFLMTPESLQLQVNRLGTINRDATMEQIRRDHEFRLGVVRSEKERLQPRREELEQSLAALRNVNVETERRIQLVEEALRQLNEALQAPRAEAAKPETTERKPPSEP
jgi:hypothetical protein